MVRPFLWINYEVIWTGKYCHPYIITRRYRHNVSYASTSLRYSLTRNLEYLTGMELSSKHFSAYCSISFKRCNTESFLQEMERLVFVKKWKRQLLFKTSNTNFLIKKVTLIFERKIGCYKLAKFCSLIVELNSVRIASAMTKRTCTTTWQIFEVSHCSKTTLESPGSQESTLLSKNRALISWIRLEPPNFSKSMESYVLPTARYRVKYSNYCTDTVFTLYKCDWLCIITS